jgi:hypothetical protein
MCCMYSPSEALVANPANEVLSRRPALQKDSPQQNVSLPTSLVCAQMKITYHSAERVSYKTAPSDRPWVRKKPADHIPGISTDHQTSIAGMATESLPGSGQEQWTFQSTIGHGFVRCHDCHAHHPILVTLVHAGQQHRMGRLDDLGDLGWARSFGVHCPRDDPPRHGQRHLDRRPERGHLYDQDVLR